MCYLGVLSDKFNPLPGGDISHAPTTDGNLYINKVQDSQESRHAPTTDGNLYINKVQDSQESRRAPTTDGNLYINKVQHSQESIIPFFFSLVGHCTAT